MARSNATNYTATGAAFPKATAASDPFQKEDVQTLAEAVDGHTHRDTRGLGVGRLDTATAPTEAGEVQVDGDDLKWWGASAAAVKTGVNINGTQTLTNKTLTAPTIDSIVNGGTLTLPTSTDRLVGRDTTDVLTNKTLEAEDNTLKTRIVVGPFTYTDLPASTANAALQIPTANASPTLGIAGLGFVAMRDGRISGISVALSAARIGGTATFTASLNAAQQTLSVTIDGTNTQFNAATQASGDTFSAGDRLSIRFDTDASWDPTTAEVLAWLELTFS